MSSRSVRQSTAQQRVASQAQRVQSQAPQPSAEPNSQPNPAQPAAAKAAQQKEGATDEGTAMIDVVVAPATLEHSAGGRGSKGSSNAALLQQMQEMQQIMREQQQQLKQLRASPQQSPQHSPQLSPRSGVQPGSPAPATATASAAVEQQSRFAKNQPRATDLQEYDGAGDSKLDEWLKQLAVAARLYRLQAREAVDFAGSRLRGAALDWWLALDEAELAAIADTNALAAALRARFQPVTAARAAREQLDKLQQGSRDVNSYIADFQRLSTQIGLSSLGEENALYAFERGLRREIAVELRKQGVTVLREAIAMAARIGGLLQGGASAQQGRGAAVNQMDIDDGDGNSSRLDRIEAALNALAAGGHSGSGIGAKTHQGYLNERSSRGGAGGRGGPRGAMRGGRGGGRGGARPPPAVPGVPAHLVQQRWDAHQCLRCGQEGHTSHACPNSISASPSGN